MDSMLVYVFHYSKCIVKIAFIQDKLQLTLVENRLGLSTESRLFSIVTSFSLSVKRIFTLLVLSNFMKAMLLAFLCNAKGFTRFWYDNLLLITWWLRLLVSILLPILQVGNHYRLAKGSWIDCSVLAVWVIQSCYIWILCDLWAKSDDRIQIENNLPFWRR